MEVNTGLTWFREACEIKSGLIFLKKRVCNEVRVSAGPKQVPR